MCGWSSAGGRGGVGTLLGVLLVLLGLFLIFLCIPFRLWVVLFGAALLVLGRRGWVVRIRMVCLRAPRFLRGFLRLFAR